VRLNNALISVADPSHDSRRTEGSAYIPDIASGKKASSVEQRMKKSAAQEVNRNTSVGGGETRRKFSRRRQDLLMIKDSDLLL
jgi:hypothetical protein